MALSYQLYQHPQDHLGQEIDRFWSVLFTMDRTSTSNCIVMNVDDCHSNFYTSAVVVSGLHPSFSEAHLIKLLTPFGKWERIQLMANEGYAVCCFCDYRSAQACLQKLDGRMLLGKALCVSPWHNNNNSNRNKRQFGEETSNCMDIQEEQLHKRAIRRKVNESSYMAY